MTTMSTVYTHLYVFAKNMSSSTSIVRSTVLPILGPVFPTGSVLESFRDALSAP